MTKTVEAVAWEICTTGGACEELCPVCFDRAACAIDAHLTALKEAGYAVVPVEATEAMENAAGDDGAAPTPHWAANVYAAMISAGEKE